MARTNRMTGWWLALALLAPGAAHATLLSRLGGLAYYDPGSNLTWLADANANGLMDWSTANSWAAGLNIDGVTGWRLPNTDTGCGTTYSCIGSEMGNLFYNVLGGTRFASIASSHNSNYGLFSNVQPSDYWSATPEGLFAWYFQFGDGAQDYSYVSGSRYAWAVHTGDVGAGVPEPGTVWLIGIGLAGLPWLRRQSGTGYWTGS